MHGDVRLPENHVSGDALRPELMNPFLHDMQEAGFRGSAEYLSYGCPVVD
jgi:hypothetical protein